MEVDLTAQEIEKLLVSITYAKDRIANGGQTYEARNAELSDYDVLAAKLREAKNAKQD
jgi:hypothetical protein